MQLDELLQLILRLVIATICGGAIGFERKNAGKPAGLRTNMLICMGSCLIMEISMLLASATSFDQASHIAKDMKQVSDPGRLAAQVISGIGFLGAGAIMQSRGSIVVGLTTAATVWANSAIGLAIGAGYYLLGIFSSALVLFILYVVRFFESITDANQVRTRQLTIIRRKGKKNISQMKTEIYRKGIFIVSESIKKRMNEIEYRAELLISPSLEETLLSQLSEDEDILSFNITNVF
ncbi:MAG: MgtC/SapB family protein [Leptospiraceae bacterium]|nr:MgtC/SapB family protein [Leptospiraceae bacterium]